MLNAVRIGPTTKTPPGLILLLRNEPEARQSSQCDVTPPPFTPLAAALY